MQSYAAHTNTSGSQVARMLQLLAVIAIIGAVLWLGLPTMLSASERAKDKVAQATVEHTIQNAWTVYIENNDFSPADAPRLAADEPAIAVVGPNTSTKPTEVSTGSGCVGACFFGGKHNRFIAAVKSESGHCWFGQAFSDQAGGDPRIAWRARENVECVVTNAPAFDDYTPDSGWSADPRHALD